MRCRDAGARCDATGPTDIDRQWVDLYVRLGADRKNVATLLDDDG